MEFAETARRPGLMTPTDGGGHLVLGGGRHGATVAGGARWLSGIDAALRCGRSGGQAQGGLDVPARDTVDQCCRMPGDRLSVGAGRVAGYVLSLDASLSVHRPAGRVHDVLDL